MRRAVAPALAILLSILASTQAAPPDFDTRVAPLITRRCLSCHSSDTKKGGLDLTRRASALKGGKTGPALVPGDLDASLVWSHVEADEMPPKAPLKAVEKALLRDWIAGGAKWGTDPIDPLATTTDARAGLDWWSFQPIVRPEPPKDVAALSPIDKFLGQKLREAKLKPAPEADRRTLIRRLAFDLTGLPPTPAEVEAFLADDRPEAYERLVDRFLASPQYGERWARLWLDLARFGESNGFEFDEIRDAAWPYRDWVINALNRDLPYDEFARLQIAGDVLKPTDPEAAEATGFLVAGAYDTVGQTQQSAIMRKVVRQDELEDLVGTVGQTFLGLTINCARCHDHKFDPIRQTEYYQLTSALAGVRQGERDLTPIDPRAKAESRAIEGLLERVAAIEAPARRTLAEAGKAPPTTPPTPFARWDFDADLRDHAGALHAVIKGKAKLASGGLLVDGESGRAITFPLKQDLRAKTFEAWVRLDNLNQRGGGVIGINNHDGNSFDTLVFAENEPGRWMAGSESFVRTQSFHGPKETEAAKRPVHLAITYAADGTVTAYRDGRPYGTPFKTSPPPLFKAGQSRIIFGIRHGSPAGNRMLAGVISRARLYDRALTAEEVAASSASGSAGSLAEDSIVKALAPEPRAERARLVSEIAARRRDLAAHPRNAHAVSPREPELTHLLTRGETSRPAGVVSAGGVAALGGVDANFNLPPDAPEGPRRVRLANWVASPMNPLFARVMVNRVWQAHFGAGFVETPSDLGFNGGKPSHPELFDWLASEFIARGFRLKELHRLIVSSDAYRRSSRPDPEAKKIDAGGRLLWRKNPTRLEAEMVRDAMLSTAGALDLRPGGPGFREFSLTIAPGTAANMYQALDAPGPDAFRRTIYRTWARGGRSGFLDAFDCPDPSTTAPRRAVTTTPLQALALMNNALTLRLADRLADRLKREAGPEPGAQADLAYRLTIGRAPDVDERAEAVRAIQEFGPALLARALYNSNEFLYVD